MIPLSISSSVHCKNHGCRQKTTEGTSSAMFDVRTIAKCCEFKRCTSTRFDVTRVTQVTVLITINTGVFLEKMCSDRRKNHGCGQKKTRRHQLCYIWDRDRCEILRTQALCKPSLQHGIDNKDEGTWTFCFPKKTTEHSFELFLSIYSYLIFFLKF